MNSNIKQPKNSDKYYWTQHVWYKMQQYGISEQTVRRIIRNPERVEEGIVPDTIAVCQRRGKKNKYEIWVMYQERKKSKLKNVKGKIVVITTWRYPGISPKGKPISIPDDILEEIMGFLKNTDNDTE